MKILLVDQDRIKMFWGDSVYESIGKTGLFEMDFKKGILFFKNQPDTISYSLSLEKEEMFRFMMNRAETLLSRSGWKFYVLLPNLGLRLVK